jgi:hypothetical protein
VELGVDDLSAIPGSFEADYSQSFHGGNSHANDDEAAQAVAAMIKSLAAAGASRPVVAACPLTRKPMVRPALLVVDGFTYERSAIEAWLEVKHASPATGQPASLADLHSPRKVVEEAKRDHALDARAQVTIIDWGCFLIRFLNHKFIGNFMLFVLDVLCSIHILGISQ